MGFQKRAFITLAIVAVFFFLGNLLVLSDYDWRGTIAHIPIPQALKLGGDTHTAANDSHPIVRYMHDADERWTKYTVGISKTFKETVAKYRQKYGRHPPPGFKEVRSLLLISDFYIEIVYREGATQADPHSRFSGIRLLDRRTSSILMISTK
jgi:hypothetical protein